MIDPFAFGGPALLSFSGGRTSAYMLWRTLQNGDIPSNVHVVFANTGKERPETLRFVFDCAERWGVNVRWIEWRDDDAGFAEVDFRTASRLGEPFSALIKKRGYLPNAVTRFCTTSLKVQPMGKFMRSLGYEHWHNVVGLRHDEGLRCIKAYARNLENKERWITLLPLDKALVTKRDVRRFWWGSVDATFETRQRPQGFDLGLRDYEGNCDYCFLKARGKLERTIRDEASSPQWWIEQEAAIGARFVTEYSYASLAANVHRQPLLISDADVDEHDVECGLHCAPETAA